MKALEVSLENKQGDQEQDTLLKELQPYLKSIQYSHHLDDPLSKTWPMYKLMQYPDLLAILWAHFAKDKDIHFYQDIAELGYVHAGLNTSSTQALRSGVIWVKKIHEFTPKEYQYGITFHPRLASKQIGLVTPKQWHSLHYIVFPNYTLEPDDAARIVTGVCDVDQPDFQEMNSQMIKSVLLLERGLEHIDPSSRIIHPHTLQLFSPEIMRHYGFIPLKYDQEKGLLHCCMIDVDNTHIHTLVQQTLKCTIQPYVMEKEEAETFWKNQPLTNNP